MALGAALGAQKFLGMIELPIFLAVCPGLGRLQRTPVIFERAAVLAVVAIVLSACSVPDPESGRVPWVFGNVSPEDRSRGVPFYTRGPAFWDNPGWGRPVEVLEWTGEAFPIRLDGRRVEPLGGARLV